MTETGERMPSVTTVLGMYSYYGMIHDDAAMRRGARIHRAIELDAADDLDESSVEDIMPYVMQWRALRDAHGISPVLVEQPVYHPQLKYAGTLDMVARVRDVDGLVLIEFKTGKPPRTVRAQMSAYAHALAACLPDVGEITSCWAVMLTPDNAKVEQATPTDHWLMFLSALSCYRAFVE
ncbi:MAG: PD-(D/E)XK nuclease family protein [Dehalococcoidia bacterium]|nr:PD-(D/E)XK nuclease family protein [Dehalococcoidia bacterium]